MKVAILGCGPAGLLAAHACDWRGFDYSIFSQKRKSELFGSQYLHTPIEGIISAGEGEPVKYVVEGSPEEYRRKTHGKWWDGIIAAEDFETDHMAWDIRQAYNRLWRSYSGRVINYRFRGDGPASVYDVANEDLGLSRYDLVINTMPRRLWAAPGEEFIFSTGWAFGDAPERGQFVEYTIPDNTIICNGTDRVSYTRLSRVFGHTTVEWPHGPNEKPHPDAVQVIKPLAYHQNNSSNPANAENWIHVGRYGKWEKGIVVSDAYVDVQKRLEGML